MKRIIILMMLLLLLLLTGCGAKMSTANDAAVNDGDRSMFVLIEDGDTYRIVYHRDTKVMYVISAGIYNFGDFTVMVDEEGKPLLYKEDADE
jgi:hypothetical protein